MNLKELLIKHEGMKLDLYQCPAGFWTIGVGRNLEANGISVDEALLLLQNDINRCEASITGLDSFSGFWPALTEARQAVLISMAFNLGMGGLLRFKKMIAALQALDFQQAAEEMLDSQWATQVGQRAVELSSMMETGDWI